MNCPNCGKPVPPARGTTPRRWCSDRCRKAAARNGRTAATPTVPDDLPPAESIREAVDAVLSVLDYPPTDPRSVISLMALKLADELDRAPSAHMARELQNMLSHLTMDPNEPATKVDEILARHYARRAATMLGHAGGSRRRTIADP